jgi:hypothetical protein
MTDWVAVWNVLNSNLVGLIIATAIGVVLASFTQSLIHRRAENHQRKQLALLLGYEIAQTRMVAMESVKRNSTLLEEYQKRVKAGAKGFLTMNEMDLFRTVYDKPTTNLSLLPSDLIPIISDIYRRVELCNHVKRMANDVVERGSHNLAILLADPTHTVARGQVAEATNQFIFYYESFLTNLDGLSKRCAEATQGLSKVAKTDEFRVTAVRMVGPDAANPVPPSGAAS